MPLIVSDPLDIYSIVGGLVTTKSGIRIDPTELKDCQNIRYYPIGGFKWRQGYAPLGDAPGAAGTGLYMARFSSGTNVAFRTQGAKIESMSSLNGTWTDRTNAQTITAGQDNLFVFDILNDTVIASNGVDPALQISSSLVTTAVSLPSSLIPSANYQHRGYMFYVTSDALYFSDLNTPATVQTNNFIRVASKQGGNIIGGVDYQGKNYVWKRHGIHAIEFQPTRVNSAGDLFPFIENPDPIVPGVGTQSHRTIVKFTTPSTHKTPGQELVFFVDQFGVPRIFDGSSTLAVGASILTSRDGNITSLSNMDRTRQPYYWCMNDVANSVIYCFMSSTGQTKHDVCWIFDYNVGFVWARDAYATQFNCGAIFENTSGIFTPYVMDYTGQVYVMNSTQTDNGMTISSYARTGDLYVKSPAVVTKWLYNEIRGTTGSDTQTIQIDYYQNGEDSPSSSGSTILFKQGQAKWDASGVTWDGYQWVYSGLTTKSSEINAETKTLSIKFSNNISGNTATVEGCSIFAIAEGWKQES